MYRRTSVLIILGLLILLIPAGLSARSESPPAAEKKKEPPVVQKSRIPRPGSPEFREGQPSYQPKAKMKAADRVPYMGDLRVSRISLNKSEYAPGETVRVQYWVENTGNITARCAVEAHLTDDVSQLGPSTMFKRQDLVAGAKGSSNRSVRVDLPLSHSADRSFVVVVVDVDDAVREQNEGNNSRSEAFEIRHSLKATMGQTFDLERNVAVYDFEVSDTEVSSEDHVDVDFRIKNQGDGLVPQVSYKIFITTAPADSPDFQDSEVASLLTGSTPNLAPGGNAQISRSVTIPTIRIYETKLYYLAVWVESGPGAVDDDPQNNGRSVLIDIDPDALPDFDVTRFELRQDEPLPQGSFFDVDFTIKNIGTRASPPCSYDIGGNWDDNIERSPGVYGHHTFPRRYYDIYALEPDESMSGSVRFQVPEGARMLWISIYVNRNFVVPEGNYHGRNQVILQAIEIEQTE